MALKGGIGGKPAPGGGSAPGGKGKFGGRPAAPGGGNGRPPGGGKGRPPAPGGGIGRGGVLVAPPGGGKDGIGRPDPGRAASEKTCEYGAVYLGRSPGRRATDLG